MQLTHLVKHLEHLAPLHFAEPWDNVGLLTGEADQSVQRVLCCIDLTQPVLDEAVATGCELVVAYHPPLFKAVKRLAANSVVTQACRRGIAIYSPHTALDVAHGGTNDVLADALQIKGRRPLRPCANQASACKLVTFVPVSHADAVCEALFAAGAGDIGDYSRCSFRLSGQGTFMGGDSSQPAVGTVGRFERVEELRVETVVPQGKVAAVVQALRSAHPYEEPAFDLLALAPPPAVHGIGRIGELETPTALGELVQRLKQAYGLSHAMVVGDLRREVTRVAMCAGAGGELLEVAMGQGAELFVTGELRHHDALLAQARQTAIIATLHTNSERAALQPLAQRLSTLAPDVRVQVSAQDRDPFVFV